MSFSARVKEELSHQLSKARHCQIAELAALIAFEGRIPVAESENRLLMQKYQLLLAELFQHTDPHGKRSGCTKILYIIEKYI